MNPFPFRRSGQHGDLARTISEIVAPKGTRSTPKPDKYGGKAPPPKPVKGGKVDTKLYATESHSRARLERMSVGQLRALHKEYSAKAARAGVPRGDLARELADIRGVLRAKGAGSVLDEGKVPTTPAEWAAANRPSRESAQALQKGMRRFLDKYGKGKKKKPVAEAMTPCEKSALQKVKAANAADLKEYPGKRGERAHARLHKTIKSVLGESAVKAALEDWMYSIPPEAVEALRPVMKIKNLTKRFAAITKTLKAHGFTTRFMGSMPANVVNDYYDTFFGE